VQVPMLTGQQEQTGLRNRRGRTLRRQNTFGRHDDADEGFLCTDKVEATLLQCLRTLDFWLLTVAVSVCTGTSLAFINNAGALVRSLGGDAGTTVRYTRTAPVLAASQRMRACVLLTHCKHAAIAFSKVLSPALWCSTMLCCRAWS
jgi:hypothetical protein